MFQTQILDVAIGLVFVYLVLSTVVSAFSEFLEVWLKRRPRMLLESVTQLVGSPEAASRIYKHPLISSLARKGSHPSYIPAKTFALAVLDSLGVLGEGGMASVLPDLSKVDGEFGDSLRVDRKSTRLNSSH